MFKFSFYLADLFLDVDHSSQRDEHLDGADKSGNSLGGVTEIIGQTDGRHIAKFTDDRRHIHREITLEQDLKFFLRRYVLLLAGAAHRVDDFLRHPECSYEILVDRSGLRSLFKHDGRSFRTLGHRLPEFFGDERHDRMNHLQKFLEEYAGCIICRPVDSLTVGWLDGLQVPCAVIIPEEFVDRHEGIGNPELGIVVFHNGYRLVHLILEPLD